MVRIQTFEELEAWKESQNLCVQVYELPSKFPDKEIFGITNQIRRASASVSANIAEGFGRSTLNDKLHFMSIVYGSLLETKNFLYLSHRLNFIKTAELEKLIEQCTTCQKLLNGFRRSLRS